MRRTSKILGWLLFQFWFLLNITFLDGKLRSDSSDQVKISVYFRVSCPSCQWFLSKALVRLINDEETNRIMDLELIPAAGVVIKSDGTFDCDAGIAECYGNQYVACLIDVNKDDRKTMIKDIACFESDTSGAMGYWTTKLKSCMNEDKQKLVQECYKTKSHDLMIPYIHKENQANVEFMPHIVLDGTLLGNEDSAVDDTDIRNVLCTAFRGKESLRPSYCKNHKPNKVIKQEQTIKQEIRKKNTTSKVLLEYFWRPYCPACAWSLSSVLPALMAYKEFQDIIDLKPYPAAGMTKDANGKLGCTKGESECIGHRHLACAIEIHKKPALYVPSIACLESKKQALPYEWDKKRKLCFKGEDYKKMNICLKEKANQLLSKYVDIVTKRTVGWMPYILVNGKVLGTARKGVVYTELKKEICTAYANENLEKFKTCINIGAKKEIKDDEKPILPCPNKKKGIIYDDPPDIGSKGRFKNIQRNLQQGKASSRQLIMESTPTTSYSIGMLILCIIVLGFLYLRMSGGHKKYM